VRAPLPSARENELGEGGCCRRPTKGDDNVGTRILTVEDDERIRTAVKLALEY
jgi:hypothetical protein